MKIPLKRLLQEQDILQESEAADIPGPQGLTDLSMIMVIQKTKKMNLLKANQ